MKIDETLKTALKKLCDEEGWSSSELGRHAGASQRTANRWLNGQADEIKPRFWVRVKPHLDRHFPMGWDGDASRSIHFPAVEMISFPLVSMAAAADHNPAIMPIADFLSQYSEDKIMFPVGMGREGDFAIRICGDSMQPWYPSGTVVLVRPGKPSTGDKVVAILGGGEVVFKYYVDNGDSFVLAPENSHGAVITVKKSDFGKIRSMYRVICSIRNELDVQRDARAEGYKPSWEQYVTKGGEK